MILISLDIHCISLDSAGILKPAAAAGRLKTNERRPESTKPLFRSPSFGRLLFPLDVKNVICMADGRWRMAGSGWRMLDLFFQVAPLSRAAALQPACPGVPVEISWISLLLPPEWQPLFLARANLI